MAIEAEFEEEGEAKAGGALPPLLGPSTFHGDEGTTQFSFRGRVRRSWQVFRGKDVEQLTSDPERSIRQARAHQENRWRGVYALVLLIAMTGQIVFADWVFFRFLTENSFHIESAIFIAFFTSVVAEVIGLVLAVTRSLFPNTDGASAGVGVRVAD